MANNIAIAITADVADLTAKVAVAKATMADASKSMRASAQAVVAAGGWTSASDEIKRAAIEAGEALSQSASAVRIYERELQRAQVTARSSAASTGQQRFAARDLAYQMQDLGVGFSMAAQSSEPFKMAMMTITQQSSQVLSAIQLMRGEAGGFIGFLGGPWGAAIMAAASVVANLAVAHASASKAADQQTDAEDDLSKALTQLRERSIHATATIEDGIRASLADAYAKRQQAKDTLDAAQAELVLARAKAANAGSSVNSGGPSYFNTYEIGEQAKQESLARDAQAAIDKARANFQKGTESIRGFQAEIAKIRIEQQFDAGAAATARYGQRVSDLAKQYREGTISLQDYAKAVREAKEAEVADKDDAKSSRRGGATTRSRGSSRSSDNAAREAARAAEEAARDELQERIAVTRQIETLAEDRAQTDIALSRIALQAKLADIATEQRAGTLSGVQAVQAKAKVNAELMQLDQDLENRLFAAKLKQLQADRSNYRAGTKEYAAYTRQIEVLEAQHQNRMAVLKAQAAAKNKVVDDRIESERDRRMKSISASWAGELARMATLQQGFGATVTGIWQSVQGAVASVIQQMLADWIAAHIFKIGATKTEAVTTATAQAALAGAGGVASMAAAPFPINLGAPAFGAAMFATSAAYGSLASFAAGTNQLPNDMIAQVHAGERIVPKADNQALLELTRRGAGLDRPGARSGGGSGGGTVVNMTIQALDGPSVRRMLLNNGDKVAAAVAAATRQGWRPRGGHR